MPNFNSNEDEQTDDETNFIKPDINVHGEIINKDLPNKISRKELLAIRTELERLKACVRAANIKVKYSLLFKGKRLKFITHYKVSYYDRTRNISGF